MSCFKRRKTFSSAKCKTALRLTMIRIKVLRNMRELQIEKMKGELINLLRANQEPKAHLKVESIHKEQNMMAAYQIIEVFCQQIIGQLPVIEAQKQCPTNVREAVATIIYAAPFCSDIPEVQATRRFLSAKYGKEFTAIADELRKDCGVNRVVIENLSYHRPSVEVKLNLMKKIANELKVEWDPKFLKSLLLERHEDLLDKGHSTSVAVESSISVSLPYEQMSAHSEGSPACASPAVSNTDRKYEEISNARLAVDRWKDYKNIVLVAQRAAESAERAAAAARVAADIASQHISESTDNESDSDGNETLQRSNFVPRRDLLPGVEAEVVTGSFSEQDSKKHHILQIRPSAVSSLIDIEHDPIHDEGNDQHNDHLVSSYFASPSTYVPDGHGRIQMRSQGVKVKFHSSKSCVHRQCDTAEFENQNLGISRVAPVFDTHELDCLHKTGADVAAPSSIDPPPAQVLQKSPQRQTSCVNKSTSFTHQTAPMSTTTSFKHPKLPEFEDLVAHFQALKALNTKNKQLPQ